MGGHVVGESLHQRLVLMDGCAASFLGVAILIFELWVWLQVVDSSVGRLWDIFVVSKLCGVCMPTR